MKTHFPYVCRKIIRGRVRWFYRATWTDSGKTREKYTALPDDPDTPEFADAYWAIRSGKVAPKPSRHTWRELITHYKRSPKYTKLAAGTKRPYNRVMEALLEKNADKDVTKVTKADVRAIHEKYADTPRAADHRLQVMSILFNHAAKVMDWPVGNPTEGIDLYGAQTEFKPWPQWLQKAWVKACTDLGEHRALTAFHLGTGTGQRAGDIVKMQWEHFADGYMSVVQEKTDARLEIYCPAKLRAYLATLSREGRHIFARNLAEPLTYSQLEKDFRRVREAIGDRAKGYTMHGWRYVAAIELAEAGCSDAEIQAVTGHKGLAMVQKYRRAAAQKALSKQAQDRRDSVRTNEA